MTAIQASELHKSYGDLEAVRGVDLSVAEGEVFCLLGPNGAGKTTVVEILEGHRLPSSGEVRVLGRDPARAERALRERVGIVLQSTGVQQHLTVCELLAMYGRYYRRRRPVAELLELVELREKGDVRVNALSGGQRRRLDLALALVGDPDLIFLDEPTTGFDPAARRHAWATVKSLCALGKTVFLTTHFMDEAQALADRVAVMRAGQIIAEGRPDELGGRDRGPSTIRFALTAGWSLSDLPTLPALDVQCDGARAVVLTAEPVAASHALTGWALERGVALEGFSVTQPSLEDVYLALTADDPVADGPPSPGSPAEDRALLEVSS